MRSNTAVPHISFRCSVEHYIKMHFIVVKQKDIYNVYINGMCDEEDRKKNVLEFILNKLNISATSKVISQINKRLGKGFYNNFNSKMKESKTRKRLLNYLKVSLAIGWRSSKSRLMMRRILGEYEGDTKYESYEEYYEPCNYYLKLWHYFSIFKSFFVNKNFFDLKKNIKKKKGSIL